MSLKQRLEAIKKRLDAKKALGNELEDSSSEEEEEEVKARESPPEIDDWEAFLYGDDWLKFVSYLLLGSLFHILRCLVYNANKKNK